MDSLNDQHATANKEFFSPITRFPLSFLEGPTLTHTEQHTEQQPKVYSPPPTHTTSKYQKSTHGERTKKKKRMRA